ncbi:MAG: PQQ-binding-like beta-propeller repeat protein [Pirellulales bacterium]
MLSRSICTLITATLIPLTTSHWATADDWPTWRGPRRDNICRETGLLDEWPEGGPPLKWRTNLCGVGYSAPSAVGETVYVMGNGNGREWVIALNRATGGTQRWASATGPIRHKGGGYPGPRSTPTIDGDRVYALGLAGVLVCLNAKDGEVVWYKDLVADFGGEPPHWGYAESVLVDAKYVLCTPGGRENTVVCLNKMTGEKVWGAAVGDGAAYASLIKAKLSKVPQYVALTAKGVIGVRAQDGEPLWRYNAPANKQGINVATPVWYKDTIFAASNRTGGGLVWVRRTPMGLKPQQLYFTRKMQNHHGGMVLANEFLYGASSPGGLTCLNYRTGQVAWAERKPGKCSVLYADGHIYCRGENGPISLVQANPKSFVLHGRFNQPYRSRAKAWPPPVIADGELLIRDQHVLLAYDLRQRRSR